MNMHFGLKSWNIIGEIFENKGVSFTVFFKNEIKRSDL